MAHVPVATCDVQIETARLALRTPNAADAEAVSAFHLRNHGHLKWTEETRPEGYHTPGSWRDRLIEWERERQSGAALRLLVMPRAEPRLVIGMVNFSNIIRGPFQGCYLGYKIDAAHEGQGFMCEAVSAAVDYVFNQLGLHRVMASYLPSNTRSANLLRRLGFVTEGYARDYLFIDGQWRDHVLTAKINPNARMDLPCDTSQSI